MRAMVLFAVPIIAAGMVAGCGNNTANPQPPDINAVHSSGLATPPSSTTTAPTKSSPVTSARGNIKKTVGEVAALCTDTNCTDLSVTFTLDKIEVNPKCTDKYSADAKPENGHFVVLSFTMKTTDKFSGHAQYFSLNPFEFSIVGPDGITIQNTSSSQCMAMSEMLPLGNYSPSSQYIGKVVLDTKHAHGVVVFKQGWMDGGWEWEY
ncbi:hypothetical protein LWC34_08535 [Kibdelosporangium philippinense]|uniref:DUF4352 domain-containing protein n=1 Tax=Kibdelosporangium philippinense TaxID=211113 RepID=A0ABS8ZAM1_9PSEU|nr:hypothetical protein [Kibdelosporangium philippinense]MCE7002877.1 hypothetical protein [Kibdelosporangium philippinense]